MALVEQAFCRSDAEVGRLIEGFRPDNVMLISDHGSRRLEGDFLLSAWLRDRGYAAWEEKNPAGRSEALNWVLLQWLQVSQGRSGLPEKAVRRLLREVVPRLPAKTAARLWQRLEAAVPLAHDHILYKGRLNYGRSSLFFGNRCSGVIYLNQAGREPEGILSAEERAAFVAELTDQLETITGPEDGRPLLSGIYTREQLYSGPAAGYAPDLVLDGYTSPWNICTPYRRQPKAEKSSGRYFVEGRANYGWHSRDGVFAFAGTDFGGGPAVSSETHEYHVMDVPATLLHLYGVAVPEDFDGQVMKDTLLNGEAVIQYQPGDEEGALAWDNAFSAEETEEIMGHLRALGYVD
jgi:predicted AlkP superfamily phosphohydrolase/phosphomutase